MNDTDLVLQWQTVVGQIEHFNDLSRRTRTNAITVVMAAYGGAALSVVNYPNHFIVLNGWEFHVGLLIVAFALIYLIAFWLIDMFYYFAMLEAAVDKGRQLEACHADVLCGLLRSIGAQSSNKRATYVLNAFYAVPFTVGLLFAYLLTTLGT